MNEKVVKDKLTGSYNKEYINERLSIDIKYNSLNKTPLSIIVANIDFFKEINNNYGHAVGEKILIDFSNLIQTSIIKDSDWVGRFDGEEFIVVLNNTELKSAYYFAEKIRKQLENTKLSYYDISINSTASFGVYSINKDDVNISQILSKVEKNLYKAKKSGRNRTIIDQENIDELTIEDINKKNIKLAELNTRINDLRESLNEICCTDDMRENIEGKLMISRNLDELIVRYMKELNDYN